MMPGAVTSAHNNLVDSTFGRGQEQPLYFLDIWKPMGLHQLKFASIGPGCILIETFYFHQLKPTSLWSEEIAFDI